MKNLKFAFLVAPLLILSACAPEVVDDGFPRPSLGNKNAPILVEEFSDLQCPACAAVSPQLEQVILENPNLARLEYRHYPLPQHRQAFKAAEASECANEQGKFWGYIKWAFDNQDDLGLDKLKQQAADMGLDTIAFNECLDSGRKEGRIRGDLIEGRRRQLQFTPSIYVNGDLIRWTTPDAFVDYLESIQ